MNKIMAIMMMLLVLASTLTGCDTTINGDGTDTDNDPVIKVPMKFSELQRFKSEAELVKAFEDAKSSRYNYGILESFGAVKATANIETAMQAAPADTATDDFSTTNIQVQGVDEADIVKTDGKYIYLIANNNLVIVEAGENAELLSKTAVGSASELFIDNDRVLVFTSGYEKTTPTLGEVIRDYYPSAQLTTAKLYDTSNKEAPKLLRTVDIEGNYLTSRKIEDDVYFVVNSYPRWDNDIIPLYRDSEVSKDLEPIAEPYEIGYIEPVEARNFITIASLSMQDTEKEVQKETIAGSGQNVFASLENMYIAQTDNNWNNIGEVVQGNKESTVVTKFHLDKGDIKYVTSNDVPGRILNQFSMDEYQGNFRIATTAGNVWDHEQLSSNNVYVLDPNLKVVGELEDLAPGERIYSVRFMGKRGYVVTFKKVDPLFVIDLEDPDSPKVLGKLKIPGYSDYLHPYDETHIIGIGKDTVEASEDEKTGRNLDFAWYQGIKMAIFDVSDVENPIELHKVVIGDRGTDSEALHNHKAFLFDREKELLVLPITLAEIQGEKTRLNQYGEYTFQGAYVYRVNLEDGFELRGRISHTDEQEILKSGYYIRGNPIRRSLYINDILYTLSNSKLQLNDLFTLEKLKSLVI
ncbi:beta-propeller domain-containing protein [Candidatus Woesearchaeota archaeon]|nr:beta-propeller domain-containing protein [Candidatus Woesearchaeota archaeon]